MKIRLKPLAGQVLVITGASSGIGLATARMAAGRGARVLLAARDGTALAEIVAEIRAKGGEADFKPTDVAIESEVQALAEYAISRFGGFDTWVNNAGVGIVGPMAEVSSEDHHQIFETNYFGLVYGTLRAVEHFRQKGEPGAIVNLGSVVSDIPIAMSVPYGATKHAIKGFTDGLRIELMRAQLPIALALIKPSAIDTPFFEHALTLTPGQGKAPGPHYAPEVVAEAILHAATHPTRELPVGSTAAFGNLASALAPTMLEAQQAKMPITDLIDFGAPSPDEALTTTPEEGRARSANGHGRGFSVTTTARTRPGALLPLAAIFGVAAFALANRKPGSRQYLH